MPLVVIFLYNSAVSLAAFDVSGGRCASVEVIAVVAQVSNNMPVAAAFF